MPKFKVRLNAYALVKQTHEVEAEDKVEAFNKALEASGDEIWNYAGVDSNSIDSEIDLISEG